MAVLNEKTDATKKKIHLMVTSLCDRNCKYCCNKQYDLNAIPYVTDEELKDAEVLYITGGEPFKYANPSAISGFYKKRYPNIKRVYVYTNAYELAVFYSYDNFKYIDGLTVSIKNNLDRIYFEQYIAKSNNINRLYSNMCYVFDGLYPKELGSFKMKDRVWQEDFKPEPNSIFRRV